MKNIKFLAFALFVVLTISSCVCVVDFGRGDKKESVYSSKNTVKRERDVSPFNSIYAEDMIDVFVSQGDEEKVFVKADKSIQKHIFTRVKDSVLMCFSDRNVKFRNSDIKVYVTVKDLNEIKASSCSGIYGKTVINTKKINIDAEDASDIKVDINAVYVKCKTSGDADVILKGRADNFYGRAKSASDINAKNLVVRNCDVKASNMADIHITVIDRIRAYAGNMGDIVYYGNPKEKDISKSEMGSVKHNK